MRLTRTLELWCPLRCLQRPVASRTFLGKTAEADGEWPILRVQMTPIPVEAAKRVERHYWLRTGGLDRPDAVNTAHPPSHVMDSQLCYIEAYDSWKYLTSSYRRERHEKQHSIKARLPPKLWTKTAGLVMSLYIPRPAQQLCSLIFAFDGEMPCNYLVLYAAVTRISTDIDHLQTAT